MAVKLGYEVLAINNLLDESVETGKMPKKQKQKPPSITAPKDLLLSEEKVSTIQGNLKIRGRKLRQLSRLTLVLNDPAQAGKLKKDEIICSYDILAVRPTSEKLFHLCCMTLEVDIISLDMAERFPFYLKRPAIGMALERGIHFEISYCPMVRDSQARRTVISNALNLISMCKGKNVIVSSSCEKVMELRRPYDVSNLCHLFDLSQAQCKEVITTNCRAVIKHAEARKTAQCVLSVSKVSDLAPKDKWKLTPPEESNDSGEESMSGAGDSGNEIDNGNSDKDTAPPVVKKKKLDTS